MTDKIVQKGVASIIQLHLHLEHCQKLPLGAIAVLFDDGVTN